MTWWQAPPRGLVYAPPLDELRLLPQYKRDAFRAFMDGLSPSLMRGTAVERHPCGARNGN